MKLLRDLYFISSPSGKEDEMSEFVQKHLTKIGIDYYTFGKQIYRINSGKPMVCAHMDQVGQGQLKKLELVEDYLIGDKNLGADDKNGIWICLRLLEEFPDISFIFSTSEESFGEIEEILDLESDKLEHIQYCLVFDRRGCKDIIGTKNNYCEKDLEETVVNLGKDLGFRATDGLFSDCDRLAAHGIPSVNISCGYYNSHTENEFTNLKDLVNAKILGGRILNRVKTKFSRVKKVEPIVASYLYDGQDLVWCHFCQDYYETSEIEKDRTCPVCGTLIDDDYYDEYVSNEKYVCIYCARDLSAEEVMSGRCKKCGVSVMYCDDDSPQARYYYF